MVVREYGFKLVPLGQSKIGTLTFTLPYAGAIRIRFEGLPAIRQALSLPRPDTPSIGSTLNKG
jgi:hypothetical protein